MNKELLISFGMMVLAVIVGGYIIGKFKLNSYEEYYEGNSFDESQESNLRRVA